MPAETGSARAGATARTTAAERTRDSEHIRSLETLTLELLDARGPGKSVCPSDVARAADPQHWRPLMEPTRTAARNLVARGEVEITQRGEVVDPHDFRGPIRIRRPSAGRGAGHGTGG
jgi:hypothetical protein